MSHRDTSLAIKQAIYRSQINGDDPTCLSKHELLLSRSKQYTELLYKLEVYFLIQIGSLTGVIYIYIYVYVH